jgi:hypothetical protein
VQGIGRVSAARDLTYADLVAMDFDPHAALRLALERLAGQPVSGLAVSPALAIVAAACV